VSASFFSSNRFGWTIILSELRTEYFFALRAILRTSLLSLVIAILIVSLFIAIYVGHILGPVERLAATIEAITRTHDLSSRALIEYPDEIGVLAHRFNSMIGFLQTQHEQLQEAGLAEKEARQLAVEREVETLYLLGRVSDFRDEQTGEHLARIGAFGAHFCRLLGLDEDKQELMRNCAPLHDIGKIAIADAILLKPGKLTSVEFEVMKRHTILGHRDC